jgi:cell fate regulator YaaT (PSP1 superfamily)
VSIHPLPQFEEDLAEYLKEKEDREAYERLNVPTTIVVRFGYTKMVGEFPYSGEEKPGCGSKIVVRTHRGTEIGEMLTSTCPNSGCSKSVTRQEMLGYIENSGGRKYPFFDQGRALRVATKEDMDAQAAIEQSKHGLRAKARDLIKRSGLEMKLVDVEPLLGGERIVVYFGSEDRVDFRDLVRDLQVALDSKVELVQVGARDEARIVADYERCGQYCCCKNFLKVLKPVSMKSAKVQKATLDPLKISGRCGRLMCCLRYEDETYEELRKRLPHRKSRVGTPEGDGIVIDSQILTQLVRVRLDSGTDVVVPVEELTEPGLERPRPKVRRDESFGDRPRRSEGSDTGSGDGDRPRKKKRRRKSRDRSEDGADAGASSSAVEAPETDGANTDAGGDGGDGARRKKKRRRRRGPRDRSEGGAGESGASSSSGSGSGSDAPGGSGSDAGGSTGGPKRKKRRKRRRGPRDRGADGGGADGGSGGGSGGGGGE